MNVVFSDADKKLWVSLINEDDEALSLLYKQFIDVLYAFGLRFTQDGELVKDAIQDLFVDLHKYRKTLATDINVKSYLFTSLKRKIFLLLKKQAKQEDTNINLTFSLLYTEDNQTDTDDHSAATLLKLKKQLALLPGRQQEALYLRFNSELEYQEIASIMDISIGTCRTLVYRGVKQLRERMVVKYIYKILA